jgi:UDP-N-acetylmuramyl pentapeptide phosphotransferase/UDP-N-acetylglucosamine-1-phosphate transferase
VWPILGSALVAFVATAVLVALAERVGFGDSGAGDEAHRKLQKRAVPPIGGLAIGIAWCCAASGELTLGGLPEWFASPASTVAALAVALAVGVFDDARPRGLGPLSKLLGQLLAGCVLAYPTWTALEPGPAFGWTCAGAGGAALACNLWNTFDNADGVAAGLAGGGFALLGNPLAAAILGFLPWNLLLRRGGEPRAYLGDGGSHLLGMTVLVEPATWPLAVLPALDLARVSALRLAAGVAPWVGDRRHLAHALERRGLGPIAVALLLVALGLLPLLPAIL